MFQRKPARFVFIMFSLLVLTTFTGCPPVNLPAGGDITTPTDKPPDTPEDPGTTGKGIVSKPVLSPAEGTYTNAQSVTIMCSTSESSVRYTTDGSQPTDSSTLYTGAINVASTTTIRAMAFSTDMMSSFAKADYAITGTVADPVISPSTGSFTTSPEVTITCGTPGAYIHYRLDGGSPQSTDPIYSGSFTVNETCCVTATAMKTGWNSSAMTFSTITINILSDTAVSPTISPAGGLYQQDQMVTITQSDAEYIYFTTDGSDPTTSSTLYSGAITVSTTGTQIRAFAIDTAKTNQSSAIAGVTYRLKAASPVVSPDPIAGAVNNGQEITLASSTPGAEIYYNPDGDDVTVSSFEYQLPFSIYLPNLQAIATKSGYEDSDVMRAEYSLKTNYMYTDGSGQIFQLVLHGNDIDISSLFENRAASMAFGLAGAPPVINSYYICGGHAHQFVESGADANVTSELEYLSQDSLPYYLFVDATWVMAYKVGDILYKYDPAGTDTAITPPHFASDSDVLYDIYSDGKGKVYDWASHSNYTVYFEYFETGSHLRLIAPYQGTFYGYTTENRWYVVDGSGLDPQFDSGEYEHFSIGSVIGTAQFY
jgi:hypothetical protein